jgi:hypothetical protein
MTTAAARLDALSKGLGRGDPWDDLAALALTLAGTPARPLAAAWRERREDRRRRQRCEHAVGDAGAPRDYHPACLEHPSGSAMYRRILVAYDGSPESKLAVDECVHLTPQAERMVHLACVLHDPSPYLLAGEFVPAPTLEIDRTRSEADLKDAASRLIQRGFSVTTHLLDGEPVEVITRMVETWASTC